jgi:hypothetical protein
MPIQNLARISRAMLAQPIAEDGLVILDARAFEKCAMKLPPKLHREVAELFLLLRSSIPNDLAVRLGFEFDGIHLTVDFEDGNTEATAMNAFFTSRKSLGRKCRDFDWESRRVELLKQGSIFEDMVEEAKDRPVDIPSSCEAAKRYPEELQAFYSAVNDARSSAPEFLMAYANGDEVLADDYKDRRDLICRIGDYMTHGCDILAIIEKGRACSFSEIEVAKLEAVEFLGPISRAKAERRMVY